MECRGRTVVREDWMLTGVHRVIGKGYTLGIMRIRLRVTGWSTQGWMQAEITEDTGEHWNY